MTINVKGGSLPPNVPQSAPDLRGAAANAYRRLAGKKPKKAGEEDPAAEAVAAALDAIVQDDESEDEREAARSLADEILEDPPPGAGREQAEAIAERLKKKLEAGRGDRAEQARGIQEKLDRIDE